MRASGSVAIGGIVDTTPDLTTRPWDRGRYAATVARNEKGLAQERAAVAAYIDAAHGKGKTAPKPPKPPKPPKVKTPREPRPPGRPTTVTPERVQQWADMHNAGHTYAHIARATGHDPRTVRVTLTRLGHTPHRPTVTDAQLAAEYAAGDPLKAIATRHKVGAARVRRAVTTAGVTIRDTPPPPPGKPHPHADDFAAEHHAGHNVADIAARHNTDPRTVIRNLRRAGHTVHRAPHGGKPAPLTPDDETTIATTYMGGATLDVIAAQWRISRRRAGRIIVANGGTIRPQLGRPRP